VILDTFLFGDWSALWPGIALKVEIRRHRLQVDTSCNRIQLVLPSALQIDRNATRV
jgi:hypothetical protein